MSRTRAINSVFPYLVHEDELKPSFLGTKTVNYDRRVKVTDWQDRYLTEPRDSSNFFPTKVNLRSATYKRFGTDEPQQYMTEMKDNMIKYEPSSFEECSVPGKMLNIFSFHLTDIDVKCRFEPDVKIYCTPENIPTASDELPSTLYRRTLGYYLEDLEKLEGMRTFSDDDLELHKKIANLKIKRYDR